MILRNFEDDYDEEANAARQKILCWGEWNWSNIPWLRGRIIVGMSLVELSALFSPSSVQKGLCRPFLKLRMQKNELKHWNSPSTLQQYNLYKVWLLFGETS